MNSAELKTLREAVGLSVKELAELASLNDPRSIRYWEDKRQPPEVVCDILIEIDVLIERAVAKLVDVCCHNNKIGINESRHFYLHRFTEESEMHEHYPEFKGCPVSVHAAMLARAKRALIEAEYTVKIEYQQT